MRKRFLLLIPALIPPAVLSLSPLFALPLSFSLLFLPTGYLIIIPAFLAAYFWPLAKWKLFCLCVAYPLSLAASIDFVLTIANPPGVAAGGYVDPFNPWLPIVYFFPVLATMCLGFLLAVVTKNKTNKIENRTIPVSTSRIQP
jgi:hypothetical protein